MLNYFHSVNNSSHCSFSSPLPARLPTLTSPYISRTELSTSQSCSTVILEMKVRSHYPENIFDNRKNEYEVLLLVMPTVLCMSELFK